MRFRPKLDEARLVGVASASASLGATQLLSALLPPYPSPLVAVSSRVVAYAPNWLVEAGKSLFSLSNKSALLIGTLLLTLLLSSVLGKIGRTNMAAAITGILFLNGIGLLAMLSDDSRSAPIAMFITIVGSGIGFMIFVILMGLITPVPHLPSASETDPATEITPTNPPVTRRTFLGAAGILTASSAFIGYAGSKIQSLGSIASLPNVDLPTAVGQKRLDATVSAANESAVAKTSKISPAVVPNKDFYQIDTALFLPNIDSTTWKLKIDGLVERPLEISYDELIARSTTVAPVTLSCVSNEVGGPLVGNAVWQGVPLTDLLAEAGALPEATQVASYAQNWSCGFPTSALDDGRTALVAVGMNGELLPRRHGFPARLVVSGLYGYVSATKWLERIELTTLEDFDGFWIDKGWAKQAPVKMQARIDKPQNREEVDGSKPVDIAGVAWAPGIGVTRVEIQVDSGPWLEAELGESLGPDAWRQWRVKWDPTPGKHSVQARATDGDGMIQTSDKARPLPNGASGYHVRAFSVK